MKNNLSKSFLAYTELLERIDHQQLTEIIAAVDKLSMYDAMNGNNCDLAAESKVCEQNQAARKG